MPVLVFIEFTNGKINESSCQAATLANGQGDEVYGVTTSTDKNYNSTLGLKGFDKIFMINDFKNIECLSKIILDHDIKIIISPGSDLFREISSLISISHKFSIVSNVKKILDHKTAITTVYTGKVESEVNVSNEKIIYLINKNIVESGTYDKNTDIIKIESEDLKINYEILEETKIDHDISLSDADVVVSAGRGLKGPENWKMIEDLAKKLNAATACSKPVSDAGWRSHHEHVGQTGLKISPKIYFAIGISGAIQHLAGVNSSKIIIVINNDPDAPFFKSADYGIVGDAFEIIPKILKALN